MSIAHPTVGTDGGGGVVVGTGLIGLSGPGLAALGLYMDKPFACCGGTIVTTAEIRKVIAVMVMVTAVSMTLACLLSSIS